MERKHTKSEVIDLIKELKEAEVRVLVRHGFTPDEIAEIMGWSKDKADKLVNRACNYD